MHYQQGQVLIGARIPVSLKEKLSKFCLAYGIKMNYFISEAIKEKLLNIALDNQDTEIAKSRLKNADFISQGEFNKYLLKRGIKF